MAGKARAYGMHTDASHRFERGVDFKLQVRGDGARQRSCCWTSSAARRVPFRKSCLRVIAERGPMSPCAPRVLKSYWVSAWMPEVERILSGLGLGYCTNR